MSSIGMEGLSASPIMQAWNEQSLLSPNFLFALGSMLIASFFVIFAMFRNKSRSEVETVMTSNAARFAADNMGCSDSPYDVIVVGAGVAGSALAANLGQHGKRVLLLERDLSEPKRIVGELLQPGGVEQLDKLGLTDTLYGYDSQSVEGYGMILQGREFTIAYPDVNNKPQRGRSFHNGRFIMKLRQTAQAHPSVNLQQGNVTKLLHHGGRVTGVVFNTLEGSTKECRAPLTVVCDGCFSLFRSALATSQYKVKSHFLGVILKDCKAPFPNKGCVLLTDPSPTLCYPISSNEIRVLIDFPDQIPSQDGPLQKYLRQTILPQLPLCLQAAFEEAVSEGRFMSMPNRVMPARPIHLDGVVMVGDSLNMRHPLTGGGMTVALTDVFHLSSRLNAINKFHNKNEVSAAVLSFYRHRQQPAVVINILSEALYEVFCDKSLRDACFAYLELGGDCAKGPLTLLAGINRSVLKLTLHFFAVALYGCGRELLPFPTPSRCLKSLTVLRSAVRIIMPLIEKEMPALPVTCLCRLSQLLLWAY